MGADTIFSKIVRKEIPADIVYETETVLAFRDISPQAPTHVLVIPKLALRDLASAQPDHAELLADLMLTAAEVARRERLSDYRVVINNGAGAGQSVFHLHLHVLGGRAFEWPPG